MFDHAGHECAQAVSDAEEVDADHPVPLLGRELPSDARERDTGVVADQMDVTEPVRRLSGKCLDRLPAADICCDRERFAVHLLRGRCEAIRVDVSQHDVHAIACEPSGKRKPNAAGGAGDDCGLAPGQIDQKVTPRKVSVRAAKSRRARSSPSSSTANVNVPSGSSNRVVHPVTTSV